MHSYINKNEPSGSSLQNTLPVALEGCGQVCALFGYYIIIFSVCNFIPIISRGIDLHSAGPEKHL